VVDPAVMSAGHGVATVCWTLLDDFKGVYFEISDGAAAGSACGDEEPHEMTAGVIFECSGEDLLAKYEGRFGPHRRVLDSVLVIAKVRTALLWEGCLPRL
jgi:hypothetical protein